METTSYQLFFLVEVYCGWINIGMIMDNSFIIPWLSFLDFQVTINNKARFMCVCVCVCFFFFFSNSKSKFPILFFFFFCFFIIHFFWQGVPWGFKTLNQTILLVLSFSQKKFWKFIFTHLVLIGWNSVPPPSLSKTKIQFLCKFIYFYFLMFSNLGCS